MTYCYRCGRPTRGQSDGFCLCASCARWARRQLPPGSQLLRHGGEPDVAIKELLHEWSDERFKALIG